MYRVRPWAPLRVTTSGQRNPPRLSSPVAVDRMACLHSGSSRYRLTNGTSHLNTESDVRLRVRSCVAVVQGCGKGEVRGACAMRLTYLPDVLATCAVFWSASLGPVASTTCADSSRSTRSCRSPMTRLVVSLTVA